MLSIGSEELTVRTTKMRLLMRNESTTFVRISGQLLLHRVTVTLTYVHAVAFSLLLLTF